MSRLEENRDTVRSDIEEILKLARHYHGKKFIEERHLMEMSDLFLGDLQTLPEGRRLSFRFSFHVQRIDFTKDVNQYMNLKYPTQDFSLYPTGIGWDFSVSHHRKENVYIRGTSLDEALLDGCHDGIEEIYDLIDSPDFLIKEFSISFEFY